VHKKINILFIIDYFHRTGGTERHLANLVQHLPREDFDCSIIVFDMGNNDILDSVRESGVTVIHLPVAREYTPNALFKAIELSKIIRSKQIDIVQTFHQKSDTYAAVVARLSGVRHIISSKRDIAELKRPHHFFLNRLLRPLFERVIVVSDAVAEVVAEKEGIEPSRITRIYNGVDESLFFPPSREDAFEERKLLGFGPDDFVVGMVAGFRPEKNHDVFFAGALKAKKVIPLLKVLAVGGGPLLQMYQERFGKEAQERTVVFTGAVSDVARYLKAMDVGCLIPGGNEGFSNAVLEKMAVGLPMVVSDVGGNAEAVLDRQNGFVIPPSDTAAFRDALVEIYRDPVRRLEMGRRSRQLVEEKYTLKQMWESHMALYRGVFS
jgi:glycosyltransferase involved in cell wall biosynthesis